MWKTFTIDFNAKTLKYLQVYDGLVEFLAQGNFKQGEQIPSVRSLAKQLRVNANTIRWAYRLLENDGLVYRK